MDEASTAYPSQNSITNSKWTEPYFDTNVSNNVTALVGKSAYLSCRVRNLGNKTVIIFAISTLITFKKKKNRIYSPSDIEYH